jgi:hypothetical protein
MLLRQTQCADYTLQWLNIQLGQKSISLASTPFARSRQILRRKKRNK